MAEYLTSREAETLALAANGENGKEISYHLRISTETVKIHLFKARQKLKAKNTAHAIAIAINEEILFTNQNGVYQH